MLALTTGERAGEHLAFGALVTGALWVSTFIVLIVEDEESGRQRLVFLKPRVAPAAAAK